MKAQKKWNIYESVILLEYYLRYQREELSRNNAIEIVSKKLRNMAINNNVIIDDIYRNVTGILFQMHSIESAYKGFTVLKPASKLFIEIVDIYNKDKEKYNLLLKEAENMTEEKDNLKENYHIWLSKKLTQNKVEETITFLEVIDTFSLNKNLIKESIFRISDLDVLKALRFKLEQDRIFKFQYRGKVHDLLTSLQSYSSFVNELKFNFEGPNFHTNEDSKAEQLNITSFIKNEFDHKCLNLYPLVYKKIFEVLYKGSLTNNKGFTSLEIYEEIKKLARIETVVEILENSSWVRNNNGIYCFTKEEVSRTNKDEGLVDFENQKLGPKVVEELDNTILKQALVEKFPKGFRVNSTLEFKKIKKYLASFTDQFDEIDNSILLRMLKSFGIIYDEKLFIPEIMLADELKEKLFSFIDNNFDSGRNVIYYEVIFNEFSDDFLDSYIYNVDMLKAYLCFMYKDKYWFESDCILKNKRTNIDPYNEIKEFLMQQPIPIKNEDIIEHFYYYPEQKVKTILSQYGEFISNVRGEYFHVSIVLLTNDDLNNISKIIDNAIKEKKYISGNELIDSIKSKYPYIIEQNILISEKGLRDAIKYNLQNQFSFKGNIISSIGVSLSMMEVFAEFCKNKNSFTLDELKKLKQELNTIINFDAVYENSLRISKDEFVSKDYASFNANEIDKIISLFCDGDFISIQDINQFGLFPDAGFSWNSFLLEHYVSMYSNQYILIHSNYNESNCVGGIVKKSSGIQTMDSLVINVLAKSGIQLKKESALDYLFEKGYLARRSYVNIEQILIKSIELRNQKGI